jgi:hypothetical protein
MKYFIEQVIETIVCIFNMIRCGIFGHKPHHLKDQYGCVFCYNCLRTLVFPENEK